MNKETIRFFRDIEKLENKLIGEDKEILEKEMYMFNECARMLEETEEKNQHLQNQVEKITQENNDLENSYILARDNLSKSLLENADLKERIGYLERSNNRKEETIIELRKEQELDKYKSVIDKAIDLVNTRLRDVNLHFGIDNEFREEYDELLEILRIKDE